MPRYFRSGRLDPFTLYHRPNESTAAKSEPRTKYCLRSKVSVRVPSKKIGPDEVARNDFGKNAEVKKASVLVLKTSVKQ